MGKISNISIIFIVILGLLAVIATFTVIKIQNNSNEKLIFAMESKVEYQAKRCFLENVCVENVTLNMLYENGYLEEIINPVTKEVIDSSLEIKYENNKVIIDWDKVLE